MSWSSTNPSARRRCKQHEQATRTWVRSSTTLFNMLQITRLSLAVSPPATDLAVWGRLSSRSGIPCGAVVNAADITSSLSPAALVGQTGLLLRSPDTWGTSSQLRSYRGEHKNTVSGDCECNNPGEPVGHLTLKAHALCFLIFLARLPWTRWWQRSWSEWRLCQCGRRHGFHNCLRRWCPRRRPQWWRYRRRSRQLGWGRHGQRCRR